MTDNEPPSFWDKFHQSRDACKMLAYAHDLFVRAGCIKDTRLSLSLKYEAMTIQQEAIKMLHSADLRLQQQLKTEREQAKRQLAELQNGKDEPADSTLED